jgi:hypothetical protein
MGQEQVAAAIRANADMEAAWQQLQNTLRPFLDVLKNKLKQWDKISTAAAFDPEGAPILESEWVERAKINDLLKAYLAAVVAYRNANSKLTPQERPRGPR